MSVNGNSAIVRCYGITKDSKTNNFMMVMQYANNGSLRQDLNIHFNSLDWESKLWNLNNIAEGLRKIHDNKLIHHDFHSGNILCYNKYYYIDYYLIYCHCENHDGLILCNELLQGQVQWTINYATFHAN